MLRNMLGDTDPKAMAWIPAHLKKEAIGTAVRGDGCLITEEDLEGNDEADRYAKAAVRHHRVPLLETLLEGASRHRMFGHPD